jgi:calcium-dependent protein kinase
MSYSNQNLLDNIQLTKRQKKIFEKKILKSKTKTNKIKKNSIETRNKLYLLTENDTIKSTSLSVSNYLFLNEINNSPEKKYKMINSIGQGSFGNVYLAENIYSKEKVAIKKLYKTLDITTESEIINEIEILKKLNHPNIVKVLEFYKTDQAYYIVSEYCNGGELFNKAESHLSERQICVIFKQILSGLYYLHSKNIVHRDLKLENILISDIEYVPLTGEEYLDIKIIDFGNAKHFRKAIINKSIVGSSYYIAPEIFMKKSGKESDLWSAGVILYMLIVGHAPFEGESDKKILSRIQKGVYEKNDLRYQKASPEVKDLIEKLLISDPKKRISAKDSLEHIWFKKYQANSLYYNITKNEILHCIQNLLSYDINNKFQELMLTYIVHNMPNKKQTKIAIGLFKLVNINGDGKLLKDELKKTLLYFVSEEYLKNFDTIFELLDSENRGYIEYEEFLRAALDRKLILTEENLKFAFNFFDKNNKGYFNEEEMINAFMKEKINEQLCHLIFEEIDLNKTGKVDFEVFKNIMIY